MFQFLKSKFKKPSVQNASPMKKIKKKIFNGFLQTEKLDDSNVSSSSAKECYAPLKPTVDATDGSATGGGASKNMTSSPSFGGQKMELNLKPISVANEYSSAPTVSGMVTNGAAICSNTETPSIPNLAQTKTPHTETCQTKTSSTKCLEENTSGAAKFSFTSLERSNNAVGTEAKLAQVSPQRGYGERLNKSSPSTLKSCSESANFAFGESKIVENKTNNNPSPKRITVYKAVVQRYSTLDSQSNPLILNLVKETGNKKFSETDNSAGSSGASASERPVKNTRSKSAGLYKKTRANTLPLNPEKHFSRKTVDPKKESKKECSTDGSYININSANTNRSDSASSSTSDNRDNGVCHTSKGGTNLSKYFWENKAESLNAGTSTTGGKLIKSVSLTRYQNLHGLHSPRSGSVNGVKNVADNGTSGVYSLAVDSPRTTSQAVGTIPAEIRQNRHGISAGISREAAACVAESSSRNTSSIRSSSFVAAEEKLGAGKNKRSYSYSNEALTNSAGEKEKVLPLLYSPLQIPSSAVLPQFKHDGCSTKRSLRDEETIQEPSHFLYLAEKYRSKNTTSITQAQQNVVARTPHNLVRSPQEPIQIASEKQERLAQNYPKYKDATTNTDITLVLFSSSYSEPPNSPYNVSNCDNGSPDEIYSPNNNLSLSKLSSPDEKTLSDLKQQGAEDTSFGNSFTSGYHRVSLRQRRDWSTRRHLYTRERPRSFNECLLSQESVNYPLSGSRKRSRIYSSINTNRGVVSPNLSRYELSSRASSTDRYLDANSRIGFPSAPADSNTKHDTSGCRAGDLNGSQSFFSASEGSIFGCDNPPDLTVPSVTQSEPRAHASRQNSDTRTYRIPLKSDDDEEDRSESFSASVFKALERKKLTRPRCNSNDLLENDSTPSYKRDNLLQVSSISNKANSHKYHKSECNLIGECECRSIPAFRSVDRSVRNRSRSSKDVCSGAAGKHSMHNSSFHLLNPLPKSRSTSGSIFLKQTVEPSKAFVYLTSIDNLDDVTEQQSASQDPLSSFNTSQTSKSGRVYEPLCQNCGLKGHSILKCDKISRVDKLYDVVMLGDRVSITHNEPNYLKSQKNKLPRCYYCGLRGHRSKSCNRLPAHIRQELDPVALTPQETTFSAFTLPRANQRRARSEGRPTPTFSTAPSHGHFADSIIDHTDFLSPNSLATDICFKRSDAFCSDVELGPGAYDSHAGARPISMYDGVARPFEGPSSGHGSLSKRKNKTLKIDSDPRASDAQDTFQRRKTFDFDDRDSGIGYGESSSQSNLENFPRGLHMTSSGHDPNDEITPISDLGSPPEETAGETSKSETDSPKADAIGKKGLKKSVSGNGKKSEKPEKTKKKNHFLRKIACMTGRYSPQQKEEPE